MCLNLIKNFRKNTNHKPLQINTLKLQNFNCCWKWNYKSSTNLFQNYTVQYEENEIFFLEKKQI